MSGNSFGKLFTVTTFGESHGIALGCIIDGCPPGMKLNESDIQFHLDKVVTKTSFEIVLGNAYGWKIQPSCISPFPCWVRKLRGKCNLKRAAAVSTTVSRCSTFDHHCADNKRSP